MTLNWILLLDADMILEGWQYSAASTDADLLRIDQENIPELGRFSLAQVSSINNEFLSIHGYPARGESIRITPPAVDQETRLIAIEHVYSQYPNNIPGNWRIKIYGAKSGFQPPINPSAIVLTLDPRVAGAIPLEEKGIALGVATLNEDGVVPDDQLPNSEWMELLGANLEATDALALQVDGHTSNTSNPHAVTLTQIGAEPSGAETRAKAYTDLKISELPSITSPTLESLGAEPAGTATQAIADHKRESDPHPQYVFDVELSSHTSSTNNPHQVTRAQLGAEPEGAETRAKAYTDQKISELPSSGTPPTLESLGAEPAGTATAAIAAHKAEVDPHSQYVVDTELAAHTTNLSNPHQLTLAQIGAEPAGAETRSKAYTDQKVSGLEYPSNHLHLWGYGVPPTGKTWITTLNTSAELGRFANLNTAANGDSVEYEVALRAGNYRMTVFGQRNTTRGVSVVYVDGIYVGDYNWYNGGAVQRQAITFDFNLAVSGTHVIKISASPSTGGSSLALSSIAINLLSGIKPLTAPIRINAGALNNFSDSEGLLWAKDLYAVGGTAYDPSYSGAVANTTKQALYQSERSIDSGTFTYTIPITVPGIYTVKLHFAENYFDNTEYSTRPLGTVTINGVSVLSNFSIFNQAGGKNRALIKEFTNLNFTNQCLISFTNTLINAIEVIKS